MATIRKRGDKWHVQVRRKGCRTQTRTFILKADAQRWVRETEAQLDRTGLQPDPRQLSRISLSDLLVRFRDQEVPNRRGGKNEAVVINAFLRQDIGTAPTSPAAPITWHTGFTTGRVLGHVRPIRPKLHLPAVALKERHPQRGTFGNFCHPEQ
jgi:hypothetical protein